MKTNQIHVINSRTEPFIWTPAATATSEMFWRWGEDNMFPATLLQMAQRSTVHRRILNDKADYISGKGFSYASGSAALADFVRTANGRGESLRKVFRRLAFDKLLFGNAFMEVVTDGRGSFLSFFHHDASTCRLSRDGNSAILHGEWNRFTTKEMKRLPLYPSFAASRDGTMRSMVHFKSYEPMMEHYGVPSYVAGMNACSITYKTDRWNISRLDNSFQMSGVMILDGSVESDRQASEIVRNAESKFAGRPGQVMFVVKDASGQENSKFIPITTSTEGDWRSLHSQATDDIVVAHSWFRTLSGLDYGAGFSAERVTYEYEIALNTIILPQQEEMLEQLRCVIGKMLSLDASSLDIINIPPTKSNPQYMKVWEARKDDGLDYDPTDATQQLYLSQLLQKS
ncbi:MAG: phage portal protein [Rikenellaceae bacterium]|jgi:hypothetical protein|nr:phage portal protein [Rikenellaceae bacterium]